MASLGKRMARILIDLIWWCGFHAWQCLRAWTGDDAYEHYLRHHATAHDGGRPLDRRRFYEARLAAKWDRHSDCGRCFGRQP